MFDRIAGVYDPLNTAMTVGLHHRWRRLAADRAELKPGDSALDVCCGTADMAIELASRVGPAGRVVGSDFSEEMLAIGRRKLADRGISSVSLEWGDALDLPYPDASFDAVTVGFGARNLADLKLGIEEMARVLRPGGRLVILEIVEPTRPPLSTFYSLWFDRLVPMLGTLTGNRDAYTYLPESVKRFPAPRALAAVVAEAGFDRVRGTILAGGIITVVSGAKHAEG
jgi:demethylmenaquinone methyltransferase/2-methoxy-6-polyprenyl-1,4-benzoquinol methylase